MYNIFEQKGVIREFYCSVGIFVETNQYFTVFGEFYNLDLRK